MGLHALPSKRPKYAPTLSPAEARKHARLLKALADPTRLQILNLLNRHGGNINVSEIVECFDLEQPTLSHHLRILQDARLVDYDKKGLHVYYHLLRDALTQAIASIEGLYDYAE